MILIVIKIKGVYQISDQMSSGRGKTPITLTQINIQMAQPKYFEKYGATLIVIASLDEKSQMSWQNKVSSSILMWNKVQLRYPTSWRLE